MRKNAIAGNKERNRKAGDLNRNSTHELKTHDGMMGKGVNPYAKMMGLSKKSEK
jgi:hypothetical protein